VLKRGDHHNKVPLDRVTVKAARETQHLGSKGLIMSKEEVPTTIEDQAKNEDAENISNNIM
jgi:hypothetical protein